MKTRSPRGVIFFSTVCLFVTACDEQTPLINADNAVRAASCALSPRSLPILSRLADTLFQQTAASCVNGGVLQRTESPSSARISADNCITANNTLLQGSFTWSDISDSPETFEWDFNSISATEADTGSAVNGSVRYVQSESPEEFLATLSFESLSLDEIDSAIPTIYNYGLTEQDIAVSKATSAASIGFRSRVERCGFDNYPLDVHTIQPLIVLESDSVPSSGQIEASADDGSKFTITITGEVLAIELDSNGDDVDDLRLSMSWDEFDGTTLATRSGTSLGERLSIFPLPRFHGLQH